MSITGSKSSNTVIDGPVIDSQVQHRFWNPAVSSLEYPSRRGLEKSSRVFLACCHVPSLAGISRLLMSGWSRALQNLLSELNAFTDRFIFSVFCFGPYGHCY